MIVSQPYVDFNSWNSWNQNALELLVLFLILIWLFPFSSPHHIFWHQVPVLLWVEREKGYFSFACLLLCSFNWIKGSSLWEWEIHFHFYLACTMHYFNDHHVVDIPCERLVYSVSFFVSSYRSDCKKCILNATSHTAVL